MYARETLKVNSAGHLEIGGADCVELAERFGTPLYVYDEAYIRSMMTLFRDTINDEYCGNGSVLYSVKAFPCTAICAIAKQEGVGCQVSSGGELYTAVKAGVPKEAICFCGNNKSKKEIEYALDCFVGCIVVDAYTEIETINEMAKRRGFVQDILLRVNPSSDALASRTSEGKFGFSLNDGTANMMTAFALGKSNVRLRGYHCHIGTQVKNLQNFVTVAERCMKFVAEMKVKNDFETEYLDFGGGFPIWYSEEDEKTSFDGYRVLLTAILSVVKEKVGEYGIKAPHIMWEPGRCIVGEAGVTLYTVGAIKGVSNVKKYICVDGGFCDNMHYALYGSKFTPILANRALEKNTEVVTVAGKTSDSGDVIAANVSLPKAESGDLLAVLSTGAYHYAMATNFERNPIPPAVLVKDGNAEIIIKAQTYEDILRNDVLPQSLK